MAEVSKRILAKNLIISQNSSGLTTKPNISIFLFYVTFIWTRAQQDAHPNSWNSNPEKSEGTKDKNLLLVSRSAACDMKVRSGGRLDWSACVWKQHNRENNTRKQITCKTSMAYLQWVWIETPLSRKEDCHPLALCLGAPGLQHPLSRNWLCMHSQRYHLQSQAPTAVLGEKLDPLGLESRMHSLTLASWGRLCRLQLPH